MARERLDTIRYLSEMHRTAITTLCARHIEQEVVAYSQLAQELAGTMLAIATGADPDDAVEGLQDTWFRDSELTPGRYQLLLVAWAGQLATAGKEQVI